MLLNSFEPLWREDAHILVLGSMPGVASLEQQQYYAHPRNLFWPLLFNGDLSAVPQDYSLRCCRLFDRRLALWDVLKHCRRAGSLDSAIETQSEVANDFAYLFKRLPLLKRICFNGQKAAQSFSRHVIKAGLDCSAYELLTLPSTSPANAGISYEKKYRLWAEALQLL
ncbi:DNA-deoxyinosine glycosylase [Agaribacterium haliotis]|uniref:DNA-deoxyinosine glycosylase n=1 Tax=Agaribacterium haliotis TaxID=2013869 RepID=UPI000BB5524E|nr:DNA-deoxyinosine glycosylase [Agaribacterium haliotis]